jgi:exodeoxyribonuclease-5
MKLSDEQNEVASAILADIKKKSVVTMGGLAGTGKSTLAKYLKAKLPGFAVCAFTGKAADVLRKKGMGKASTIHSLIYEYDPVDKEFYLKDDVPCDGFLVDEASMLSGDLYADLLSFGKPIVLIGDHGQLEPVGDNPNLMADPMYRLETIHRYAGELAHFAQWVRQGKSPAAFRGSGAVQMVRSFHLTPGKLAEADQVICRYNTTRVETNSKVRSHLGRTGRVQVGDRVMCLRNNKELGLFNGMQGKVKALHAKCRMDFTSDDDKTFFNVEYDPAVFNTEKPNLFDVDKGTNPFDYAYCATAHKCQGSEWDTVLVIEQRSKYDDHCRWAYTAATRAKERLLWVAAPPPRQPDQDDWF